MAWVALNCPQCSAPLPRVAIWRSVKCASCGALITRTEAIVKRDDFRQALVRARQGAAAAVDVVHCGGASYSLMQRLGSGEVSEVHLAQRSGPMPFLATLKLSTSPDAAARYAREAEVLRELHDSGSDSAMAYAAQRLPDVVTHGPVDGGTWRQALALRYPTGFWGSLATLHDRFPQGIDPRHAVWIWRRMLDVLHFIHAQGWAHGDIRPEHALVHPQDHGIRIIGWAKAQKGAPLEARSADLVRSARVVQVLVGMATGASESDRVPTPLADLLERAGRDQDFCRAEGAQGLDALLRSAAQAAFGAPAFVPLNL